MAGTDDFDAVGKDQYAHRRADEVVAVDERVGDQLFPDDAGYFGLALGVEDITLRALRVLNECDLIARSEERR